MAQAQILVVDDEPDLEFLILQKFRKKINAKEYRFHFAQNGEEALEKLKNNASINLILTDINMPVMDGLTLLSRINELGNRLLRSVIVSAYGDMENIRIAMNRGAYDFITKPINLSDLEITIEKSLREIELYQQAISSREKLIALHQELDIARKIQTSILPKTFPNRNEFDIFAEMITAKKVGGDLYDFFFLDKNRLAVIIGDVSGKGIAAAMLMAVCKTLLKATAYKGIPADDVLTEVNNMLVEESPVNMFVTVFFGVLDIRNGAFEYSNGGHNLPYLVTSDKNVTQLENIGGLVLGAMKNMEYKSNLIMLKPGESLFFYTDGITEAFNGESEEFDENRLEISLSKNNNASAKELARKVLSDVKEFSNGVEQSDDITCLALKFLSN